jgi:hypothetical protein
MIQQTMMPILFCKLFVAASLALAPSDRMQMADRMFAKGLYAEAASEYAALKGAKTVSADDIAFRIAECDRMIGREKEALAAYDSLIMRDIPAPMRAVALYRLACERNDPSLFLKCEQADPKGRYAVFARLKRALVLAKSDKTAERREATGIFLDLSMSSEKSVANEALYAAATLAYGDRRWNEAAILFPAGAFSVSGDTFSCLPFNGKEGCFVRTGPRTKLQLSERHGRQVGNGDNPCAGIPVDSRKSIALFQMDVFYSCLFADAARGRLVC